MIYLELVWGFLQVGCFAFGGAYAAIPFIRGIVLHYGWLDETTIAYIIAISESTPGPIMINMATYVGQSQGGLAGSLLATAAVVTPAFFVTILVMVLLQGILHNRWVRTCLRGLMPCIAGIIMATGLVMLGKSLPGITANDSLLKGGLALFLIASQAGYRRYKGRPLSPIVTIVIAAILGLGLQLR